MVESQMAPDGSPAGSRKLFIGCFVALVATSFAFIIRVMVMDDWQISFGLTETQKGEIFGAGMWPFGLSIVLFSLVIDKIGYGRSMIFAFACHAASCIILITAGGYTGLYIGSVLNGLAAGTVEAVINPAVASMYPKKKTKMLSILHAGWPGGMVLGGLLIMGMEEFKVHDWQINVGIILIPTVLYGLLLSRCKFPVSERVAAGVSYRDMLKEAGALGFLIVLYLIFMELNRLFGLKNLGETGFAKHLPSAALSYTLLGITALYFIYTRSLGRFMYIFLLLVMILLATTELGTDSWISDLMKPAMSHIGLESTWVLIYTASVMMILRFCIGPIERLLKPLGVLFCSAAVAAVGLYFLSSAEGIMILVLATLYAMGKCFFWPVTLGLVAERFPKGGALTLNAIAGVGMLGVGIVGGPLLGFWQDTSIEANLQTHNEVYHNYMNMEEKKSVFGTYTALNGAKVSDINDKVALYRFRRDFAADMDPAPSAEALDTLLAEDKKYLTLVRNAFGHHFKEAADVVEGSEFSYAHMVNALREAGMFVTDETYAAVAADKQVLDGVTAEAKRDAMSSVALLPLIMAICYLGLILYFRGKGGYEAVDLQAE